MTLVENFVCNEAYFELYPIFDREPVEFFQLRGNVRVFRGKVTTLQSEFWTNCNLFNSKSVSDKKEIAVVQSAAHQSIC